MTDKRSSNRTQTTISARLISDRLNVFCTILDLSPTGARLQIEPGLFLPRQFLLRARELGSDRRAEVVWRNRTQVGVRFGLDDAARPGRPRPGAGRG